MTSKARSLAVILVALTASGQGYIPPNGFIPDAATAVKVAEAVLTPVYGEQKIKSEEPFKAKLEKGVWTVKGTLHCPDGKGGTTTLCAGGAAEVKLSKIGGRIMSISHYK